MKADITWGDAALDVTAKPVNETDNKFVAWDPNLPVATAKMEAIVDSNTKTVTYKASYAAKEAVLPTDPTNPQTPNGYVLVQFNQGTNGSLSGIDKDGTLLQE